MRIKDVLRELEALENAIGDLYGWLADRFGDDPEAARFFSRMERDERSHANLLGFEQRLVRTDPKAFQPVVLDLAVVSEVVERVRAFRRDHPEPQLTAALTFAMQIEEHCAEHLHRRLIVESNPEVEKLVASLAAADHEHFLTLRRFVSARAALFG